jgi:DNA-binding NtrC family response regulator
VGTTVTTYLPVVDEPLPAEVVVPETPARTGAETILLVEDNVPVRDFMCRTLKRGGYSVLEAQDTGHALTLAKNQRDPIHLLLSDIVMPGMNGPNLAQLLLAHHPGMKVLYVSGFPHTVLAGSASASARVSFLAKPFRPATLLATVRQCLDS